MSALPWLVEWWFKLLVVAVVAFGLMVLLSWVFDPDYPAVRGKGKQDVSISAENSRARRRAGGTVRSPGCPRSLRSTGVLTPVRHASPRATCWDYDDDDGGLRGPSPYTVITDEWPDWDRPVG